MGHDSRITDGTGEYPGSLDLVTYEHEIEIRGDADELSASLISDDGTLDLETLINIPDVLRMLDDDIKYYAVIAHLTDELRLDEDDIEADDADADMLRRKELLDKAISLPAYHVYARLLRRRRDMLDNIYDFSTDGAHVRTMSLDEAGAAYLANLDRYGVLTDKELIARTFGTSMLPKASIERTDDGLIVRFRALKPMLSVSQAICDKLDACGVRADLSQTTKEVS